MACSKEASLANNARSLVNAVDIVSNYTDMDKNFEVLPILEEKEVLSCNLCTKVYKTKSGYDRHISATKNTLAPNNYLPFSHVTVRVFLYKYIFKFSSLKIIQQGLKLMFYMQRYTLHETFLYISLSLFIQRT